jgi:hypothetical protein
VVVHVRTVSQSNKHFHFFSFFFCS